MVGGKICCHMELVFAIMYLSPAKNSQLTMTYFNIQSVKEQVRSATSLLTINLMR